MPAGRTPHGVRGLKSDDRAQVRVGIASHPSRGAWIEITVAVSCGVSCTSHPSRGAWIEIALRQLSAYVRRSHPSRGAWIEIGTMQYISRLSIKSHPSRGAWIEIRSSRVVLWRGCRTPHGVRGLKLRCGSLVRMCVVSHPSRGAWIEISTRHLSTTTATVAPLTGCVD